MTYRSQMAGIWAGVIALNLFFVALYLLANFLPYPKPSLSAAETAQLYLGNSLGVRLGGMVMLFSIALLIPFYTTISAQLRRTEGISPIYSYTQLACGIMAVVNFLPAIVAWAVAAYRPDRPVEIIQMLSDFAFIGFLMPVASAFIQLLVIGLAILSDKSETPVYPRWGAYLNFWGAILFQPGLIVCLFLRGPFAWNGIVGFWIPAADFGIWTYAMAWLMYKDAKRYR